MNIIAAQFIAENLERRQFGAADRRALRKEAQPVVDHSRAARAARPRRLSFRLRIRRTAHA